MKKSLTSLALAAGLVISAQAQAQTIQPFSTGLSQDRINANFSTNSYNCRPVCYLPERHRVAVFWRNTITGAKNAQADLELNEHTKKAARFLMQATFGATARDIAQLSQAIENEGEQAALSRWIDEQAAVPQLNLRRIVHSRMNQLMGQSWWQHTISAPDQLRQRITFALNHIMTISRIGELEQESSIADYYDTLARNAFGNHRNLIKHITYNIGMGVYLDNASNTGYGKPNENYARELMQLFTIGPDRLNLDGTPQRDANGEIIPAYNEEDVYDLARALTGLTRTGTRWEGSLFMKWWRHSHGTKFLFRKTPEYYVIRATRNKKRDARSDIDKALGAVTSHPNVAPFLSKRLIQHFVTSNPSPAYVARVAKQFRHSGGNLKATIKAVLLDQEARNPQTVNDSEFYGRLKEPVVRMTGLARAFKANPSLNLMIPNIQRPLYAASVFSFFQPDDTQAGLLSRSGKVAPEFNLVTSTNQVTLHNKINDVIFGNNTRLYLDKESELALSNPAALVDRYNLLLMGGNMSEQMKNTLMQYLENAPKDGERRARNVLYLVMTSAQQAIQQ